MIKRILVLPKQGLVVKNPLDKRPLPADRTTAVILNQFWLRRLAAGDVVEAKPKGKPKIVNQPVLKKKENLEVKNDVK